MSIDRVHLEMFKSGLNGSTRYFIEHGTNMLFVCCSSRDVKPENVILDEDGHAHLTDFNIATVLKDGEMAVSVSGTKPYMGKAFHRLFLCHLGSLSHWNIIHDGRWMFHHSSQLVLIVFFFKRIEKNHN